MTDEPTPIDSPAVSRASRLHFNFRQLVQAEKTAVERLRNDLASRGIDTVEQVAAAGYRTDLAARGGGGRVVLIDIKMIRHPRVNSFLRNDLRARAALVRQETGLETVFAIAPFGVVEVPAMSPPLVRLDEAADYVASLLSNVARGSLGVLASNRPEIFVAMPFSRDYSDVFSVAIRSAASALKTTAYRVDHNGDWADIVQEVRFHIDWSAFVVADLSEARPNVLYGVGYAHAKGKKTLLLRRESPDQLPFDVAHEKCHTYVHTDTHGLQRYLRRAYREILRDLGLLPLDGRTRAAASTNGSARLVTARRQVSGSATP